MGKEEKNVKKEESKTIGKETLVAILLGILSIVIIIFQIATINPKSTKLEVALLNILQFIFSIGFSWFMAKISFKSEYLKNQKRFGIAAYRRITEIDKRVSQLINKIYEKTINTSGDRKHDLEVFEVITSGIKESINSCIADWGDIIGDELDTLAQINELSKERVKLLSEDSNKSQLENYDSRVKNENSKLKLYDDNELKQYDDEISRLISSLPDTIKVQFKEYTNHEDDIKKLQRINMSVQEIIETIEVNGYFEVEGFWKEGYSRDIMDFKVGDLLEVYIEYGDLNNGLINVRDSDAKMVGRLINILKSSWDYEEFAESMRMFSGNSKLYIELSQIDSEIDRSGRRYFKGRLNKEIETKVS